MGTESGSRHGTDGEETVFECAACGARRAATTVEYDALGYPVCPACSHSHSP